MSNFLKKGQRLQKAAEKKDVKKRIKRMYSIMNELDNVALAILRSEVEYNEDNIVEVASEHTDLTIGKMEAFLLLGKLQSVKDHYENKIRNNAGKDSTTPVSDESGESNRTV